MARLTQKQVEDWIAQNGGASGVQYSVEQKSVRNPSPDPAEQALQPYVPIEVEVWRNARTGAELSVRRGEGGDFEQIENKGADPNKPSPGGTRTPEQQQIDAANAQSEQALNRERQWNSDHGYGWVTHAQRQEQINQQQAQARADNNVARQTAAQEAANQLARDRLQFDRDKANLPDVKATDVPVNGAHYTHVVTTTPQGQVTIKNYGPDGKPVDALPSEGAASAGGPSMATYIRDGSIQGLTALHTALWNDPSLTPQQRQTRFQEAVQVANLAVQQAATDQRERESTRNAEYNTASTKLQYMQNGLNQALDFVSKINGNLPEGSGLGGQAFAALLGLQMLQMQASGINNLPSLNRPQAPTITAADLTNPARMAEHNQSVSQATAAAAAPPVVQGTPSPVGDTGAPPVPAATSAPRPTAAAPAPASAAPAPTPTPDPNVGQPGEPMLLPSINAVTGEPTGLSPLPVNGQFPDSAPLFTPRDPATYTKPAEQPSPPDYGQPGMTVLPQPVNQTPVDVTPPPFAGDQSSTMPTDWPILGRYMQPQPAAPQQPQAQAAPPEEMPALRRARIASTPPWRLDPSDLQWAEQNGLMNDAMAIPGRQVA